MTHFDDRCSITLTDRKEKTTMSFDPKALHRIIIKDQNLYEQTSTFLE
jgi:hypothetical protein